MSDSRTPSRKAPVYISLLIGYGPRQAHFVVQPVRPSGLPTYEPALCGAVPVSPWDWTWGIALDKLCPACVRALAQEAGT